MNPSSARHDLLKLKRLCSSRMRAKRLNTTCEKLARDEP
jgi:hypothetical protein